MSEDITITRQLAQIVQGLRYIRDDLDALSKTASNNREEYREEIQALRGDLAVYFYEQTRNRAELDDLKKKLSAYPNTYNPLLLRRPNWTAANG